MPPDQPPDLPAELLLLRTRSLTSVAAQEIERLIVSGTLPAGSRLNEQALAARLGISRGPVREAVRGLERQGLVVTVVNQGSYVRSISAEEAMELYDLRALLTGQACERLAAEPPPETAPRLEGLVARMERAADADDAPGYYALNLDFHAALLELGSGPRAQRIYADLGNELNLFRRRALVQPEKMRESNAEHAAILAAIRAGDPVAARAAAEAHVQGGKRRFAASHTPL
ncbi:GntR family transcriptional regulator [Roseomonas sp. 18066]|uniref:GntR family transcriptional regulator n=1 Tax=Roseomonas sp. 18066 TaxID=2681412 RepID=UPI001358E6DA|nr:GntR family transcriptional regulator [Roseomonas sp. 18066]